MTNKRFHCSVNRKLINKNEKNDDRLFVKGFIPCELTGRDLLKEVRQGYAFSYVFSGDRKTENFEKTGILAVDVDAGRTLQETINDPFVSENALFIYTTQSHTEEQHRYRIVFGLEEELTEAEDVRHVSKALTALLSGDYAATDAARIFYGSTNAKSKYLGKTLSAQHVNELRVRGTDLDSHRRLAAARRKDSNSISGRQVLDLSFEVMLRSGQTLPLEALTRNTSVYCPFHRDHSPSAFVDISPTSGTHFLHCRVCGVTWWTRRRRKPFNFYAFEEAAVDVAQRGEREVKQYETPFGVLERPFPSPKNIVIKNEPKLTNDRLPLGLTFIKSPKGTGKTTSLPRMFEPLTKHTPDEQINLLDWLEENQDVEGAPIEQPHDTDFSILLIGHRQALIREMCQRLKLNCYLDDAVGKDKVALDMGQRQKRYGICLDSLPKVKPRAYDLIIIDESEQVLSHFFAETMRDRRQMHFVKFRSLLRASPRAICLDADLGWITYNTITRLAGATSISKTSEGMQETAAMDGVKAKLPRLAGSKRVHIFINQFVEHGREIKLYESRAGLVGELIEQVRQGKRVFVASNSKSMVESLEQALMEKCEGKKVLAITSANSRSDEVQAFIQNIKLEVLKYDAVLCSPSLGTGVDITFPEESKEIDVVFGFFESGINNHFEIDQQLARVRHPKEVRVWISRRPFSFETELGVVTDDILRANLSSNTYLGFDPDTLEEIYKRDDDLVVLASLVVSRDHASQNALRKNFIDYKTRQGFNVVEVDVDKDIAVFGEKALKEGKREAVDIEVEKLMSASPLTRSAYQTADDLIHASRSLDPRVRRSYQRHSLEIFYRQEATEELIRLDDGGRHKGRVLCFERLIAALHVLRGSSSHDADYMRFRAAAALIDKEDPRAQAIKDPDVGAVMMVRLLEKAGLLGSTGVNFEREISALDLKPLVQFLRKAKVKQIVELQLSPVRDDLGKKPTRFLGDLLRSIGLTLTKTRTDQRGGTKTYFYRVADDGVIALKDIVSRRRQMKGSEYKTRYWEWVHRANGFAELSAQGDGAGDEIEGVYFGLDLDGE